MKQFFELVFGEGPDLEPWQMAARAIAVFFSALVFIRISGRRSFGQHHPFDACVTVLLGAVLSRAVVGASPFWGVLAAAAAMAVVHRLLGVASVHCPRLEDLVNGVEVVIVREGRIDRAAMRRALVTERNLAEAIRQTLGDADISKVKKALLERDGRITVIGAE